MEGCTVIMSEIHVTTPQFQEEVPKAWGVRLKFTIPFHLMIRWTSVDRLLRLGRNFEIMYVNGRILKQTLMFEWINPMKDEVIDDVFHFCLSHLSFRYLMIRSFDSFRFSVSNSVLCLLHVCWMMILLWEFWQIMEHLMLLTTCFICRLLDSITLFVLYVSLISFRE